jgi:hypothetical protein
MIFEGKEQEKCRCQKTAFRDRPFFTRKVLSMAHLQKSPKHWVDFGVNVPSRNTATVVWRAWKNERNMSNIQEDFGGFYWHALSSKVYEIW